MKILRASVLFAAALALVSCETTGDPSRGGLFGWSEGKAHQDTVAMRRHLDDVEADNAYQQGRRRALEEKAARKQRELNDLEQ